MEARRILFLLRHPPYGSSHALEALETVLVAGVFDQQVSVLFSGDGVWQLVADQDGGPVHRRTVGKIIKALPQYDVTALFACAESLRARSLTPDDLALPVDVVDFAGQRTLIEAQDAVVND